MEVCLSQTQTALPCPRPPPRHGTNTAPESTPRRAFVAPADGGAININSPGVFKIHACTFTENYGDWGGGAIFVADEGAVVTLSDSIFTGNNAGYRGTDLMIEDANKESKITNCVFNSEYPMSESQVKTVVQINQPVPWHCQHGYWMPHVVAIPYAFSGCYYPCPAGFYGNTPDLVYPSGEVATKGCSACALAQHSPSTSSPSTYDT